eukprot:2744536-Alexandrium_andersonii.AAC.1
MTAEQARAWQWSVSGVASSASSSLSGRQVAGTYSQRAPGGGLRRGASGSGQSASTPAPPAS